MMPDRETLRDLGSGLCDEEQVFIERICIKLDEFLRAVELIRDINVQYGKEHLFRKLFGDEVEHFLTS